MANQSSLFDNEQKDPIKNHDICMSVVHKLINLPGFQLLKEDEFSNLVQERFQQEHCQEKAIIYQNVALNIYSEKMYQATAAKDKPYLREEGFQELSKYLYRMAYNFYLHQSLPNVEMVEKAQESTQVALEQIYTHLLSVKAPGGFLKWCGVILRHVCLEEARRRNSYISLEQTDENIEIPVFSDYLRIDKECIYECLRSAILRLDHSYQQVIKFSYFSVSEDGSKMSDAVIAAELKINLGTLYTRRSRAISLLRKDEQLYSCIQGML